MVSKNMIVINFQNLVGMQKTYSTAIAKVLRVSRQAALSAGSLTRGAEIHRSSGAEAEVLENNDL